MPESVVPLIAVGVVIVLFIVLLSVLTNNYSLNGIKSKTVGDGQHGTARWATAQEVKKTFATVPFDVTSWREGKNLPKVQGLILGSTQRGKQLDALVDRDDVHCLMIGASGVGKTAFFLYPNLEFACASGMSYVALDTKGDLSRNYGTIAQKYYGYHVSVIDLRNPTRSDGSNLLTLINRYMDIAREHPDNLAARAKAEKYAKILAKTIVNPGGDDQDRGQNAFFYDAAEGLLTSVILLLAEYVPPDSAGHEKRHIVSVYIDELQDYLSLPTDLSDALAQARGLGLGLTLAHQYRGQLPTGVCAGIDANARNKIVFGLNATDAKAIAAMAPELSAEDFMKLPRHHVYASFQAGGKNTGWIQGRTMPPLPALREASAVRARSAALYGTPWEQVDQEYLSMLDGSPLEGAAGDAPIGRRKRS